MAAQSMSLHPMFLKTSMMTPVGRLSITINIVELQTFKGVEQCCSTSAQRSAFSGGMLQGCLVEYNILVSTGNLTRRMDGVCVTCMSDKYGGFDVLRNTIVSWGGSD